AYAFGSQYGFQVGGVERTDPMFHDIEVARLLAQVGMHLGAPLTQLENAILARTRENRRIGWTLAVIGRKPNPDKTYVQAGGPRLADGVACVFHDLAATHLLAVPGLAIGAIGMDEVIFH